MLTPNFLARASRREVNEQVSMGLLGAETDEMTVQCECGNGDCDAEMTLHPEAYRSIRLKGLFVVRIGHEPASARVISRNHAFVIVDAA
jgi:hypothetical protein